MSEKLPVAQVHRRPPAWADTRRYTEWPWTDLAPLPHFILADGRGLAVQQTEVRLCYDANNLYVRFDCTDQDIWGKSTERDAPIYDEEVVELFIAPGADTPVDYYEFEVSPLGTLLDLTVHSPDGDRRSMRANFQWDCPDLCWQAERHDAENHWRAYLVVPWRSLLTSTTTPLPKTWRANFYRIERPHDRQPEFSCWSSTFSEPADYHRPACFGTLLLADADVVS